MNKIGVSVEQSRVLEFKADRQALLLVFVGVGIFLLTLWCLNFTDGRGLNGLSCISITLIALGLWKRSNIYLKIGEDFFETRLAPARGHHTVLYSEVTGCEFKGAVVTVFYRKLNVPADSTPTKIRLPLSELRDEDRALCVDTLRRRLPPTGAVVSC